MVTVRVMAMVVYSGGDNRGGGCDGSESGGKG